MKKRAYERISITLPPEVLRQADQAAAREGRSRSWVIAEAVRRMVAGEGAAPEALMAAASSAAVREPVVSPYAGMEEELAAVAARRLRAMLALTPAERLQRAEGLIRLARAARPRGGRAQVVGFERFEDFWRWKSAEQVTGAIRT